TVVSAQPRSKLPKLVELKQAGVRPHPKLALPKHDIGPTIPGLRQGAIPQGLVYWEQEDWFLISHYFEEKANTSVVTAVQAKTGKLEGCLTLGEASGEPHMGHVGGLAVSDKYLWIVLSLAIPTAMNSPLLDRCFARISPLLAMIAI